MSKIDDLKLQMFVDGELDVAEIKEVENFINSNMEAKKLVDSYKKINHLVFSTYNNIKSEDLPRKTLDLLIDDKPSFISQLLNYKIKLVPAFAAAAAVMLVAIFTFNVQKDFQNPADPNILLSDKNQNIVLNQLENIIGQSQDNLLGVVSHGDQDIQYEEIKSYSDNKGRECKDFKFSKFQIKEVTVEKGTFCKLANGQWKATKLEFLKGNLPEL